MRSLLEFVRLSGEKRGLLLRSLILIPMIRVGLYAMPFLKVKGIVEKAYRQRPSGLVRRREIAMVHWAIDVATRYVGGTCLNRALAAQVLFGRLGLQTSLRIGAKTESGELKAHAWVESNGIVLLGGSDEELAHYARFPIFDTVKR